MRKHLVRDGGQSDSPYDSRLAGKGYWRRVFSPKPTPTGSSPLGTNPPSDFGLSRVCSNRIDKCPAIVARKTVWETGRTAPSSALDTKAACSRWSGGKPTNQNHQVSIADRSSEGSKVFPVKAHQLQFLEHVVVVGAGIRRDPRLQHRRLELVKA